MQKVMKSNILLSMIEDSYRAEYTEWNRRNLRFSDAGVACKDGEKCERQIYYDIYMGDQKSLLSSGSLVLFDDGRMGEADIRRRLRLILRSPEREVDDLELGARGKIDNTVYLGQIKTRLPEEVKDATEDPGLEIKTVNQFQYQEMANSGQILSSYYDQIQYYLWVTKKPFWFVLIKNRNSMGSEKGSMPYLEFIVMPDTERQAALRAGLKTTKEALELRILPPRPFLRDSTQCQFCRFKHLCWPIEEEVPKEDALLVGLPPTQEILESALRTYTQSSKQIKDLETQQEEARAVILQYFNATNNPELLYENIKATYSDKTATQTDMAYLKSMLTLDQLAAVCKPEKAKLEALIANREVDAIVLEGAFKSIPAGKTLRITEVKLKESARQDKPKTEEVVNVDQGIKRSKKVPAPGKAKARRKSSGNGKGKRNKAKRN